MSDFESINSPQDNIKEELDRLLLDLNSAKKKGKEYATKEQNEAT